MHTSISSPKHKDPGLRIRNVAATLQNKAGSLEIDDQRSALGGQQAQAKLIQQSPPSAQVVQRLAFVNGKQITPDSSAYKGLSPNAKLQARDSMVRDFISEGEANKFAARQTDYIGNIPSGSYKGAWVRYSASKMNVLGESHTTTPLHLVTQAVGSTSFQHERFTDIEKYGAKTQKVDEHENAPRYADFGVSQEKGKETKHQGEALLPKIAFAMNRLQLVDSSSLANWTQKNFDNPKTQGIAYAGKPYLTYLKYAVAILDDLKPSFLKNKQSFLKLEASLYTSLFDQMEKNSDVFSGIAKAKPGSLLGDILPAKQAPVIASFAATYLKLTTALRERDDNYKKFKYVDPGKNPDEHMKWRDAYMFDQVQKAYKAKVRYFGMGKSHLLNLSGAIDAAGMDTYQKDNVAYFGYALTQTKNLAKKNSINPKDMIRQQLINDKKEEEKSKK